MFVTFMIIMWYVPLERCLWASFIFIIFTLKHFLKQTVVKRIKTCVYSSSYWLNSCLSSCQKNYDIYSFCLTYTVVLQVFSTTQTVHQNSSGIPATDKKQQLRLLYIPSINYKVILRNQSTESTNKHRVLNLLY